MGAPARLDTALLGSGPGLPLRGREIRGTLRAMGPAPSQWDANPPPAATPPPADTPPASIDTTMLGPTEGDGAQADPVPPAIVPCFRCQAEYGCVDVGGKSVCCRCLSRGLPWVIDPGVVPREIAKAEASNARVELLRERERRAVVARRGEQKAADARARNAASAGKQRDRANLERRRGAK